VKFAFHIAISHLRSRRKAAGVSGITMISIAGVTIGVAALNIVLAVMAGFEVDLRDKILGSNAHLVVTEYSRNPMINYEDVTATIAEHDGITGAAPFIYTEMMIKSRAGVSGAIVKGIDPGTVNGVLDLVDNLVSGPEGELTTFDERSAVISGLRAEPVVVAPDSVGSVDSTPEIPDSLDEVDTLAPPEGLQEIEEQPDYPGIILGEELAAELQVFAGDTVHLVNPLSSTPGPFGTQLPEVKVFEVAGIFYSGMYEYDTKWTYIHIEDAQEFLHMPGIASGVEAKVLDLDAVDAIADALRDELGFTMLVRHWKDLNAPLFDALKTEKVVMGIILGLIVTVASLNIAGTLILLVLSKGREISILRAMGATGSQIRSVFMLEGVIIGSVGAVLGTCLGLLGSIGLKKYGWPLDTDVYYLDSLPVVIQTELVALVALIGVAICFVATLYPASKAASLQPVEGLRYE
jgi:lipoprotein-releasing system permease protein